MESRITDFCKTPRTLRDVCLMYGFTPGVGHDTLKWMVQRGALREVMHEGCVLFRTNSEGLPADIGM